VIRDVLLAAPPTRQFVAVEPVAGLAVYLASDISMATMATILRSMTTEPRTEGWDTQPSR
jgi:hypothetical protein